MTKKQTPIEGTIRSLHIGDMIPDDLRGQVDPNKSGSSNVTGANYLTVGVGGTIQTPSGQSVDPDVDLNKISTHFTRTLQSELEKDVTNINVNSLIANSPILGVTDAIDFENIQSIPFTIDVSTLSEAKIITDATMDRFTKGQQVGRFVDADDADNLVEITSQDSQQQGVLRANGGNDSVIGTQSNDSANGNSGNDTIIGAGGEDLLRGGNGADLINGGQANDIIDGNRGEDTLIGGGGDDIIRGGAGHDFLYGNAGNDTLIGDIGSDFLSGGEGADDFILRGDFNSFEAAYADRILDFNPAEGDRIKIANLKGVEGMEQISFAAVDVNKDGVTDTAILCSCGDIVGVIMSADPSQISVNNSVFMVAAEDKTLSKMI
ncbi:calcium-binding protein [Kamptonema sp. UHCC 0994]|uniref:calcium-binding protein n=1 Tax=Kamptonema sp. UHCC 0994 TaxID=3031329 RepID=UPI0023BA21A0|nr:calcium-binding protein [Kamptonema sp. UHCC 0994]MDF0553046.1 calcium-binding protein [Kamptonema sp. UHCC 0994]